MRGKGMAFSYLTGGAGKLYTLEPNAGHPLIITKANLLNQFAWPVALDKIGWKTYICFIIWCAVQTIMIYFFIPETNKRTVQSLPVKSCIRLIHVNS